MTRAENILSQIGEGDWYDDRDYRKDPIPGGRKKSDASGFGQTYGQGSKYGSWRDLHHGATGRKAGKGREHPNWRKGDMEDDERARRDMELTPGMRRMMATQGVDRPRKAPKPSKAQRQREREDRKYRRRYGLE